MESKILYVDPHECTGCGRCELACSFEHEQQYNSLLSRIRVVYFEDISLGIPTSCTECEEKACMDVCPSGAIKMTKNDITVIDENICIGCKQCVFVCPFGAISFIKEKKVAIKCDLCDGDPECIKNCPTGAIQYLQLDRAVMKKKRKYLLDLVKKGGI
jgi:Fe-S-cluster-containing hydrogenase component 2